MTKDRDEMTWRELIEEAVAERGDTGKEIICTLPVEVLDKEPDCNDENWTAWCGDWIYTPGWEFEVNPYVHSSRRNPDNDRQNTKWVAGKSDKKEDVKAITEYIFRSEQELEILAEAIVQENHYQLSHSLGYYVLLKNEEMVDTMDTVFSRVGENKDKLLDEYIARYLDR